MMHNRKRLGPPRLTIVITNRMNERIKELIPFKMKRLAVESLVDLLLEQLEQVQDRERVVRDVIGRNLKLRYADGSTKPKEH